MIGICAGDADAWSEVSIVVLAEVCGSKFFALMIAREGRCVDMYGKEEVIVQRRSLVGSRSSHTAWNHRSKERKVNQGYLLISFMRSL